MVTYSNFFFSNAKIPISFDLFSPSRFYRKTQIIPNILLQSGYNKSFHCFFHGISTTIQSKSVFYIKLQGKVSTSITLARVTNKCQE